MPKHISIEERSGELTIIRRWFSAMVVFSAFFVLFWNTTIITYYIGVTFTILNRGEGFHITNAEALSLGFPLLHLLLGIGFFYYTLCGFVNRTLIRVSFENLSVSHEPLPWFGKRNIAVHDIKQLYCQQHKGNKGSLSYSVNVITNDFTKIRLISGLGDSTQARFIEETVEKRLNITDEAVEGEFS